MMANHSLYFGLGLTVLLLTSPTALFAQEAVDEPEHFDLVEIAADTAAGSSGRVAVNIAAGNANQQANDAVIAIGDLALTTQQAAQRTTALVDSGAATSIIVEDGAFSGITGLSSINITAGNGNQMVNLAALAIGNNGALTDQLLEQSRAPTEPNGGTLEGPAKTEDRIAIGETAFGNGSGLIQVNLIGGEGNSSANTFSLTVVGGEAP